MTSPQTSNLLHQRRFMLLAIARTTSVLGNGFGRVALAFGVLALPGSTAGDLSLVLASQAVPQLVFILLGGVLADRVSRARLMVGAEVLAALAWGALAMQVRLEASNIPLIALTAALAGFATAMFSPAMTGLVPELVKEDQLQSANALIRLGQNISLMLGLAMAGIVVAIVGPGIALAVNAASFAISGVLIVLVRAPRRPASTNWFGTDFATGMREFLSRQWLWVIVVQFAFVVAAINATVGVLGPLISEDQYGGAKGWSILVAAQALGAIFGALVAARISVSRPLLAGAFLTFPVALPMLLLAAHTQIIGVTVGMLISGLTLSIFSVLWSTALQRHIPSEILSRVSSFDLFGALTFAPLGLLVAGPLATVFSTEAVLWGCGGLVILSTVAALLSPEVRTLRAAVSNDSVSEDSDPATLKP